MNPPAARHDRDRRGGDEGYPRKNPRQEPAREPARPAKQLNEYFIEGDGISREVLQIDICKHLGPEATSRPGTYNSKKGFFIKALRPFTTAQLEDLRAASEGYQNEAENMRRIGQNPRDYEYSQTRREFNQDMPVSDPSYYSPSVYPPGGSGYPPGSSYPPVTGPGYPSLTYAQNPSYPAYSMASTSGMPASMYSNMPNDDPRYASNYIYAQTNNPGYPQERYPQYSSDPRYEAQQPPRGYAPSLQDPTGRAIDRPPYEYSQPPSIPFNSNTAAQYSRPGPSSYEAPQNRDPYRQGPQQNPYESHRRR